MKYVKSKNYSKYYLFIFKYFYSYFFFFLSFYLYKVQIYILLLFVCLINIFFKVNYIFPTSVVVYFI